MESYKPFFGYYFFNALLMVLQGLHIFWAGLILRMVYKFQKGKVRISSRAEMNHRASLTNIRIVVFFTKVVLTPENWTHKNSCICFCLQLEKDERSDEESEVEEEDENRGEKNVDQGGDYSWEKSRDTLNSRLSMLTSSCVLNNLTNHRASVADKMRKAQ